MRQLYLPVTLAPLRSSIDAPPTHFSFLAHCHSNTSLVIILDYFIIHIDGTLTTQLLDVLSSRDPHLLSYSLLWSLGYIFDFVVTSYRSPP